MLSKKLFINNVSSIFEEQKDMVVVGNCISPGSLSENFTNCCMHEIFLKHVENGCDNFGDLCTAQL